MSYKIAALGHEESVFPFRQIGVDVFTPGEGNALLRQVAQLIKEGYLLLFVSEDCLSENPVLLETYDSHPTATLVPIPGLNTQQNIGLDRIQSMVEKALGQNIL